MSRILKRGSEAVNLLDLGPHRLRDLERPENLFQLQHPELPSEFPALQCAALMLDQFADGAWLVDLAPLAEGSEVARVALAALGARESAGQSAESSLVAFLGEKQLLLLLDNCEHVIDSSARLVDAILSACPNVKILATSRELLGVGGEMAWQIPVLSMPEAFKGLSVEQ
jgi:predicted ATPase